MIANYYQQYLKFPFRIKDSLPHLEKHTSLMKHMLRHKCTYEVPILSYPIRTDEQRSKQLENN